MKISGYHPIFDADINRLCELFTKESLGEYGLGTTDAGIESIRKAVRDHSFLLLAPAEDRINKLKAVGVIAGYLVKTVGSDKPALQEVIWYVDPEYRQHGKRLLEAFEAYARTVGARFIVMCLMCNSQEERVDAIYRRRGYKRFEVQYIKDIANDQHE